MNILIIGGVAAGMSAAAKAKRTNPESRIVVLEKGRDVSYGACGLPYYISGLVRDAAGLTVRSAGAFRAEGIDVRLEHEALRVDPVRKEVRVRRLQDGTEYVQAYDKLLVAVGASPIVPPIPGRALGNVHLLKTLEDGIRLKKALQKETVRRVAIVGGGYIGMELVEAMVAMGKEVRLIERSERILRGFDKEITGLVVEEVEGRGVHLHLGETVEALLGDGRVERIKTDQDVYDADVVILSVGIRPNTLFLEETGIDRLPNGAIRINDRMETSLPDIYAAGDCASVRHRVLKEDVYIPLATNANKQGRLVGQNFFGAGLELPGVLGTAAARIIDMKIAKTGVSEAEADDRGWDVGTVFVKANSHAGYCPEVTPIHVKLIYDRKTGRLLGAQTAGEKGAVLRIDTLAACIHNGMSVREIGLLDLCYAPPFAPVWDAIHIAANAAK